jgi:DNA-binding MarR family transcriptional regulator
MNELDEAVRAVQRCFPQVYFACHVAHARRHRSEHSLSDLDSTYLGHLDTSRPTSPRRLARHLGIASSTLSAFLKRMEGEGYLERKPAERDRRELEIRLTRRGEDALSAASVLDGGRLRLVLSRLSDADRRAAVVGLRVLAGECTRVRARHEESEQETERWETTRRERSGEDA